MATQRYISTSFWDDEWIQTLDPSEKLLYLYLMTNPLTNIAGVYKITIKRICFDTGFNADTVGHILAKFKKAEKAYIYKEFVILPSWPKHQKAETRIKIAEGIDAIIAKLSKDVIKYMVSIGYRYHIKGYEYPPNYLDLDSNTDIDSDLDSKASKPKKSKKFIPPTLDEVKACCAEKGYTIDPQLFIDHYSASSPPWYDSKGCPVLNWKQRLVTWNNFEKKKKNPYTLPPEKVELERPHIAENKRDVVFYHPVDCPTCGMKIVKGENKCWNCLTRNCDLPPDMIVAERAKDVKRQ